MIRQLLELLETCNKQFPVEKKRHNITLNPETGTLELGVWVGEDIAILNLDDAVLAKPAETLAPPDTDGERARLLPKRETQSPDKALPVAE